MNLKIIKNDIKNNKIITIVITAFITLAAMLVSLAFVLIVNLFGAIDTLMINSKTPHFMQMHSGDIDLNRLNNFADDNQLVDDFQVLEFLNVEGAKIILGENSLASSVQDNGFQTQGKTFDYLTDLDGVVITPKDGEVYVPIMYMKEELVSVGDKLLVDEVQFRVAGFLRDSQMNSALASSKRFLISENDYLRIENKGNVEYLIEFRLNNIDDLKTFENMYIENDLEANGPTVTYPLFRILNSITDGLMISIILLISSLVLIVALLCIRFTLLTKIEDEIREISVLKALGIRLSDIKKIYLAKYIALSLIGSLLGFLLSFLFKGILLENIKLYMGEPANDVLASFFGFVGALLISLTIVLTVNFVLRQLKKISIIKALQFGTTGDGKINSNNLKLNKKRVLGINTILGIKDVLGRKKTYLTILFILIISVFIMIVPQNLYSTIKSDDFITYMGLGNCDLIINVQQTDNMKEKSNEITNYLARDNSIEKYVLLTSKMFELKTEEGKSHRIKVELGDHSLFPVKYIKGNVPKSDNEIALSSINADELEKEVGDNLTLIINNNEVKLKVSGIYSDITNGGKTAKAIFKDEEAEILWYMGAVDFKPDTIVSSKAKDYSNNLSYAKIASVEEYFNQMYGSTVESIFKVSIISFITAILISSLIILLFMKMLITKDKYLISVMKSLGFTSKDIKKQYLVKSTFVLLISVILGTILANTVGEMFGSMLLSMFGASSLTFVINPLIVYFIYPLCMVIAIITTTVLGINKIKYIKISDNIKSPFV